MSEGAPDFGPGDLVVCVNVDTVRAGGFWRKCGRHLRLGFVYRAAYLSHDPDDGVALVRLNEVTSEGPTGCFLASRFRRLDPLPPEFFAGRVEEGVGVEA